ncbi:flagellar biosynthesis protein FlhF [bacterium]|nr:flagellar biosynthesis protein FlhF [bacterium]
MMRYKTYEAETLQQAILKMTIDLGRDAILISHRHLKKGGFLGLFGKKIVEVTAALPRKKEGRQEKELIRESEKPKVPPPSKGINKETELAYFKELGEVEHNLRKEMKEIKETMKGLFKEVKGKEAEAKEIKHPGKIAKFFDRLIEAEVDKELSEKIISKVVNVSSPDSLNDEDRLRETFEEQIAQLIPTNGRIEFEDGSLKIIALIGPTGVGKTTTLAKLAATFTLEEKKKVGIITIDTYRIAAIEQLKTFAEILGVPLKAVFDQAELESAINDFSNFDLVLIDTAGRSQKDSHQMTELKDFIDLPKHRIETCLVISATTKEKDLADIVNSFREITFNRIIFTKLDETNSLGPILNILSAIGQGDLSYLTTGQNVPEDIEVADSRKIAKMILENQEIKT